MHNGNVPDLLDLDEKALFYNFGVLLTRGSFHARYVMER